ncbi:integrase catalytic domain-containing protein [Nephila pilipes]|uniref:Integrase catalytic domain-containing protein n=1 Tax=Nephila pilipes TaxID=299642 RepID=A0A8X6NN26_NEPPI|nr:integrase catalytic domain-containing protein [Nephila pilipes]
MKRMMHPNNTSSKRFCSNDETKLYSSFPDNAVPPNHFHLGEDIFAAVTYFATAVQVHLRQYKRDENNRLFPTKRATLYDMLETKLRALESLGRTKEKFADFLEPLVESCLPENVLRAWERSRISESTDDAISQRSLEKLMCFLRHEVESEEMIRLIAREGFGKDRGSGAIRKECQKSVHKDEPTAATLISSTTGAKLNCIFCDRPHLSQDCQKLSDMSYEDRKSQVIRKRCCLVCLKSEWPSELREKYKGTIQFFEENGILKVQTRLILSQDPEDFTHPTVLPDHPLLERLVLHTHRSLMHAGVLTTLAQLREKFWIPKDIKERETFDLDLIDSQHVLKRVRYLHTLRSNLRKRFYKEYLGELVRSPKVASRRKMISLAEIVIVESKIPNRMNWPLAQVIELFPGKDGVERVAKLRLASVEIIRPLQRIYPLELSASDHLIEDHQGTDIAAQSPGSTAADVLEEGKKSRCGHSLIPVKKMTEFVNC